MPVRGLLSLASAVPFRPSLEACGAQLAAHPPGRRSSGKGPSSRRRCSSPLPSAPCRRLATSPQGFQPLSRSAPCGLVAERLPGRRSPGAAAWREFLPGSPPAEARPQLPRTYSLAEPGLCVSGALCCLSSPTSVDLLDLDLLLRSEDRPLL